MNNVITSDNSLTKCPPLFFFDKIQTRWVQPGFTNKDIEDLLIEMKEAIDKKNSELDVLKQWYGKNCGE